MEWQTVSGVVGLLGGLLGFATFMFRLAENHQPPSVSLEKLPGDGNDTYSVEVVNPCLAPVTIREAGISFGEKRQPLRMGMIGDPAPVTDFIGAQGTRSFILPARGAARCSVMRTKIGDVASRCGADPRDDAFEITAYCEAAYSGLWRKNLRLGNHFERILVKDAKE